MKKCIPLNIFILMFKFSAGPARHNLYKCYLNYFAPAYNMGCVTRCNFMQGFSLCYSLVVATSFWIPQCHRGWWFLQGTILPFLAFLSDLELYLTASIPSAHSKREQGHLFPRGHNHSTGYTFKHLLILWLECRIRVLSCSGRHHAVLTHALHIWIPSMFTGISQRPEGLVQKYNTPVFIRSISCHRLGDPWKMLDMLRLLGINSAHDCAGCIQHLTIILDQLLMV